MQEQAQCLRTACDAISLPKYLCSLGGSEAYKDRLIYWKANDQAGLPEVREILTFRESTVLAKFVLWISGTLVVSISSR